jgi:hypothetical protein
MHHRGATDPYLRIPPLLPAPAILPHPPGCRSYARWVHAEALIEHCLKKGQPLQQFGPAHERGRRSRETVAAGKTGGIQLG